LSLFFLLTPPPPRSTLFPYTTLFRSLHVATALARLGGGSTSFTSEIDTAGKFFTNRRNHMKNQPKLPAMMPQSAHVGLYVAFANRSNGSPASDTTMIT